MEPADSPLSPVNGCPASQFQGGAFLPLLFSLAQAAPLFHGGEVDAHPQVP